ncbi:MAG: hypothetical protein K9N46_15980 [Candidatus Marinimicrobia bacterium]|nr:hypothetical protein [Candidatus Neomarinimicrobiota bacterium]MCF7830152.1 hypothetical protein [Candidatus Neomarinimicrobiota bacterium]MCF7882229.1 hypothetical protein [Candidatus Neomarinimicrobiota bacterium]
MTKLEQVLVEIESLSVDEFSQLRDWIIERDWEKWDEEIRDDAEKGRLEFLKEEAIKNLS